MINLGTNLPSGWGLLSFGIAFSCVCIVSFDVISQSSTDISLVERIYALLIFIPLNSAAFLVMAVLAWFRVAKYFLVNAFIPANAIGLMILRNQWIAEVGSDAQAAISLFLIIPIYVFAYSMPLSILFLALSGSKVRTKIGAG